MVRERDRGNLDAIDGVRVREDVVGVSRRKVLINVRDKKGSFGLEHADIEDVKGQLVLIADVDADVVIGMQVHTPPPDVDRSLDVDRGVDLANESTSFNETRLQDTTQLVLQTHLFLLRVPDLI